MAKYVLMSPTHLFYRYLPPDPEFLPSLYDLPELVLCLFQDCSSVKANFLTFFSGHVATIVSLVFEDYVKGKLLFDAQM